MTDAADQLPDDLASAHAMILAHAVKRKPLPLAHLPRERVVIAAPTNCLCCGSTKLAKLGEDVTETLEVIPRQWKVIQTVREKFTCRECEKITQPMRRFRYDAKHDTLKCPRGKTLKARRAVKHGRFFTSRAADCRHCDLGRLCLSNGRVNKAVVLGDDYPALLRARRRRERWSDEDRTVPASPLALRGISRRTEDLARLSRAIRRGLINMKIQAYRCPAGGVKFHKVSYAICYCSRKVKVSCFCNVRMSLSPGLDDLGDCGWD